MTVAASLGSAPLPEGVSAVRRWARANLWAVLIVAGLSLIALLVIPPAALDNAIDWLFIATLPVLAVLEAVLLIALYRLFKDRDRLLAALTVVAGVASIVAGLVSVFLTVTAQPNLEAAATATGSFLTAAELVFMAALVRRASATPARLWVWGVAAGVGTAAASVTSTTSDTLLLVAGLLALAFPVFLFRLGQLSLPVLGATAR